MLAVYIIGFTIRIKHSSYICLICISNCYICAIGIVKGIDQACYIRVLQLQNRSIKKKDLPEQVPILLLVFWFYVYLILSPVWVCNPVQVIPGISAAHAVGFYL